MKRQIKKYQIEENLFQLSVSQWKKQLPIDIKDAKSFREVIFLALADDSNELSFGVNQSYNDTTSQITGNNICQFVPQICQSSYFMY